MLQFRACWKQLAHVVGALLTLLAFLHSHLGRPKGVDQRYSLARVTAHLSALLETEASCALYCTYLALPVCCLPIQCVQDIHQQSSGTSVTSVVLVSRVYVELVWKWQLACGDSSRVRVALLPCRCGYSV